MTRRGIYLLMGLHVACSAVTYVLVKTAAAAFPDAESLAMARSALAAAMLLALTGWAIPAPRFTGREWLRIAVLGVLLVPLNQWMFLRGMRDTLSGHAPLIYAMTPVGVLLLQSGLARRAPPAVKALGVALALAGVVALLRPWGHEDPRFRDIQRGDLWICAGTAVWVVYTVASAPMTRSHDPRTVTAWILIAGTAAYLPFGAPALLRVDLAAVSAGAWGSVAWLAAVTSVAMMLLWSEMLRRLEPVEVAVCSNLQPVATAALVAGLHAGGLLAEGQDLGWLYFGGTALVLSGVTLAQRGEVSGSPSTGTGRCPSG